METGEGLERQRQQLMGNGTEQMNLNQVKERAIELRTQIAATVHELRANPGGISFDRVLEKFGILNAQYDQLQRELRPQLRYHIAHPLQVDATLAALVPHQLATKTLPEMEAREHEFLQQYPTLKDGESAIESALVTLCNKPDAHNDVVDNVFERPIGHSVKAGPLHEQSDEQTTIRNNSKKLQKAIKTQVDAITKAKAASKSTLPQALKVLQGSASVETLR